MSHPSAWRLEAALQHHGAGRLAEAQSIYQEILHTDPDHPEALHLLGVVAHQVGRDDLALPMMQQALAIAPDYVEAHNNLGNVQHRLGHGREAVASFNRALELKPAYPEALNNLGNVFKDGHRLEDAVACYCKALVFKPDYADAHCNLGQTYGLLQRWDEAVASLCNAVALVANHAGYHLNLGNVFRAAHRLDEAVASYRRAVALAPEKAEGCFNLGSVLIAMDRVEEGMDFLRRGLTLNPNSAQGYYNLGNGYQKQGKPELAIGLYRQAVGLQPDFPDALFNEGLSRLLLGDFREGWSLYEWRRQSLNYRACDYPGPSWCGDDLKGRTLLLYCEQGFGDSIQLIRFVPKITGGRVALLAPSALVSLFAKFAGVDYVASDINDLPKYDCQASLLSLPHLLGTTLETIPTVLPYLVVDGGLKARYGALLRGLSGLKVGIVWRGDARHVNDHNRSMVSEVMGVLVGQPGYSLVGLQRDASVEELGVFYRHGDCFLDAGGWLHDFSHTAAIVANLDLVIGVDTAVIHLAGALGCPTWVMLPVVPDWRWLLDRSDSPWYPGMRLFRQKVRGDWNEVIDVVAQALGGTK